NVGDVNPDLVSGDNNPNTIFGGALDDILVGNGGADHLVGNGGNDQIYGGPGVDKMEGGTGNDIYNVDNAGDQVIEKPGEGFDTVYASVDYTLPANVEHLHLVGAAGAGTGNSSGNAIFGTALDNVLDGGGGADGLYGLGGNDTFVFHRGEANGDVIADFDGNGAALGDSLKFIGYGTAAQGANLQQLTSTLWQVNSADGATHEIFTLANGAAVHPSDVLFV